jgi:hypothetical protein
MAKGGHVCATQAATLAERKEKYLWEYFSGTAEAVP